MSKLLLKSEPEGIRGDDKLLAVPALQGAPMVDTLASHATGRSLRRRFSATRLRFEDNSFRPFRIY
jgi:hypothetical protein